MNLKALLWEPFEVQTLVLAVDSNGDFTIEVDPAYVPGDLLPSGIPGGGNPSNLAKATGPYQILSGSFLVGAAPTGYFNHEDIDMHNQLTTIDRWNSQSEAQYIKLAQIRTSKQIPKDIYIPGSMITGIGDEELDTSEDYNSLKLSGTLAVSGFAYINVLVFRQTAKSLTNL